MIQILMQIPSVPMPFPDCIVAGPPDLLPDNWLGLVIVVGMSLVLWLLLWLIKADRHQCVVCDTTFTVHLPKGINAPADWICPMCHNWVQRRVDE